LRDARHARRRLREARQARETHAPTRMTSRRRRLVLLLATLSAAPAALGLELVIRAYLMPPEVREVYAFIGPELTRLAWWLVPSPLVGLALGLWLEPRLYARALERLRQARGTSSLGEAVSLEERAGLEAMFFATSIPQLFGFMQDFGFLLGADVGPVLATMPVSMASVLVVGLWPRARV
jgi:hypothetical protein